MAYAPPCLSSNASSYPPYYCQCPVPRKVAVLLNFITKSQLPAFKGVQFSTWIACPPQAKQRAEVISQPNDTRPQPWCHFPFWLQDRDVFAAILAFISCVFLFLNDMTDSVTLPCQSIQLWKLEAYVSLFKTNYCVLAVLFHLFVCYLWKCTWVNFPSHLVLVNLGLIVIDWAIRYVF